MACKREALFPDFGVQRLRNLRGALWAELVERIAKLPETHPAVMAFTLTIRRIRRDLALDSHTHCHVPGCAICAAQVALNFKGDDEDLLDLYSHNLNEIYSVLARMRMRQAA